VPKTLAEIAIEAGLVARGEVARAGRQAEQKKVPLVVALVRDAGVDELALLAALRKATRVQALDPAGLRPDAEALRVVSRDVCRRHRVLPLSLGTEPGGARVLRIAMADPTDAAALAEIEHVAGCDVEVSILPLSAIDEHLQAPPPRRLFGDGVPAPSTQPHARANIGDDTALTPATTPYHSVADEADLGLRQRALIRLLEQKGILAEGELENAVIDLMRAGRQGPDSDDD